MTLIQYQWKLPDPIPEKIKDGLDSFSTPFRSVLFRRGCKTPQDAVNFLLPQDPDYPQDLELRHLDAASKLISEAVCNNKRIAIFGDYDVDGITATALFTLALSEITSDIFPFIPNRIIDGYGLKIPTIDSLHEQDIDLLITVDNGIRSHAEVSYAKSLGMDVIITDHHQPADTLPDADAIINPKLPGDPYPNKNLAGVGVVYKLVSKLANQFPEIEPTNYLDLVALGTIADIVPLTGENRYLVKQGLIQINQHRRQALLAVLGASGMLNKKIIASDISFQIAPRFNSSGRLADANHLVPLDLLLSPDSASCGKNAQLLEIHNDRRKKISQLMQVRIESQFSPDEQLPPILISFEPDYDLGVAGIAAGHLTRKFYLPAIVGAISEETTTASCRSIPEFDIISALNELSDLFTNFGGHKLAAGFTINNEDLSTFSEKMTACANRVLSSHELTPTLEIDAVVQLADLGSELFRELMKLEPTGEGNPTPVFLTQDVSLNKLSKVGQYGDHLKFIVDDGTNTMPAIAFGLGSISDTLAGNVDLTYHFSENEYRGKKEFQLQVLDIKPHT